MSLVLPDICYREEYNNLWHYEDGLPAANHEAPNELKEALDNYRKEVESASGEQPDGSFVTI